MCKLFSVPLIATLALAAGCSSDSDDGGGDGGNQQRSFSAENEVRRFGVMYRVSRDVLSIAFPYLKNGFINQSLGGTSADCLDGGAANYTYFVGPVSGNPNTLQRLEVQFDNCVESIGEINGLLTVTWSGANEEQSAGTFGPTLTWNLTVGEFTYIRNASSGVTTNFNDASGFQRSSLNLSGSEGSTLQGPTGPSLTIGNAADALIERASSQATSVTFSETRGRLQDGAGSSSGYLSTTTSFTASVAPASSVVQGIGTPISGGLEYTRSRDVGPTVRSTLTFSATEATARSRTDSDESEDAGTFTWDSILANPIFVQRGF
tara:strand:+ start:845 stop:1804 length:960 start_codon:yes stop_codon:yes gene_type:complete